MNTQESFIQSLAAENTGWKTPGFTRIFGLWFAAGCLVITMLMALSWDGFRDNFVEQLSAYPRFLFECLFGLGVLLSLVYFITEVLRPGSLFSAVRSKIRWLAPVIVIALLLLLCFAIAFPSLPISMEGKRPMCVFEVLIYGSLMVLICFPLLKKFPLLYPSSIGFCIGSVACIIPALLMHIGCMYEPLHVLSLHFSPLLLTIPLAIAVCHFSESKKSKERASQPGRVSTNS